MVFFFSLILQKMKPKILFAVRKSARKQGRAKDRRQKEKQQQEILQDSEDSAPYRYQSREQDDEDHRAYLDMWCDILELIFDEIERLLPPL